MGFLKSDVMKKAMLCVLLLVGLASQSQGQTLAEWFDQKNTQRKYLVQQIAALQVYIGYLQKGYKIAKDGLHTISGFTKGEWDLHTDFINSLKSVNPEVRHYVRVADIIAIQVKIVQNYNRTSRQLRNSDAFSGDELDYIEKVFTALLDDCDSALDELITLTTDDKLEMKDDERIKRIDQLHTEMQDKLTFSQSFSNDATALAASRLKEKNEAQTSRALQGIKK